MSQRLAQGAGQRQQAQNRACWRKCCAISRHIVKQYSLLSDFPKSKESDKNGNFHPPRKAPKTEKRPPSNSKPAKPLEILLSSCTTNLKKKVCRNFTKKIFGKKKWPKCSFFRKHIQVSLIKLNQRLPPPEAGAVEKRGSKMYFFQF